MELVSGVMLSLSHIHALAPEPEPENEAASLAPIYVIICTSIGLELGHREGMTC